MLPFEHAKRICQKRANQASPCLCWEGVALAAVSGRRQDIDASQDAGPLSRMVVEVQMHGELKRDFQCEAFASG